MTDELQLGVFTFQHDANDTAPRSPRIAVEWNRRLRSVSPHSICNMYFQMSGRNCCVKTGEEKKIQVVYLLSCHKEHECVPYVDVSGFELPVTVTQGSNRYRVH
ncbi:Hypothetical predicted protein [Scomber scombrus]|uniref:Uncharacterized protein n=1 Tax=Scomber scombrus TaxID=13677 RepID=A0AAV1NLA4_SCOSC